MILTMRWALAEASAAPWAFSTDTVVALPWLFTAIRYFSGGTADEPEELNNFLKKPGSLLSGVGST